MMKSTRKIVHIGYPKTGTTSLQIRVLGPLFRARLISNYVGVSSNKNSKTRKLVLSHVRGRVNGKERVSAQRLFNEFAGAREGFFISDEGLIGLLREETNQNLVHRLARNFDRNTEIVLTIRKNLELLTSLYQQKVKTGYLQSPNEFFLSFYHDQTGKEFLTYKFAKLYTDDLVESLMTHFEKVTVIDLNVNGYYRWLIELTGVSSDILSQLIGPSEGSRRRLNPSLSAQGVMQMERLNSYLVSLFPFLTESIEKIMEQRNPNSSFRWQRYFGQKAIFWTLGMLKASVARLLILKSKFWKQQKYQLPSNVEVLIKEVFPESKVSILVSQNGGIKTFKCQLQN